MVSMPMMELAPTLSAASVDAPQREAARLVENLRGIAELRRGSSLREHAADAFPEPDGIGDVAEHETDRLKFGIHLTIQLLRVGRGCEARSGIVTPRRLLDRGADGDEFEVAAMIDHIEGNAGQPDSAVMPSLPPACD